MKESKALTEYMQQKVRPRKAIIARIDKEIAVRTAEVMKKQKHSWVDLVEAACLRYLSEMEVAKSKR